MAVASGLLAHGHWQPEQVSALWLPDTYEPSEEQTRAADVQLAALAERGSPSHDGLAARFVGLTSDSSDLKLELQQARWALRLLDGEAGANPLSSLCIVRRADGAWLAGRRAPWVATWAGRWALGAGGAVEVGEDPTQTLTRELHEEWSLTPERMTVRAVVRNPSTMVLIVGVAWLGDGAEDDLVMDEEHDEHAWWPANPDDWPAEADAPLRIVADLLK